MLPDNKYLTLSDNCSLRNLETPSVYDKAADELYELDAEAFDFLKKCNGSRRLGELGVDPAFVESCLKDGILSTLPEPHIRHFNLAKSPRISLRYLELQITSRCNLRCKHCYLSAGDGEDLELLKAFKAMDEFDRMQGLRLLISGGEPLMHRRFWYLNERLEDYGFRSVLLSNGTLINRDVAARLKAHEVQISIDGMRESHDVLRGIGSFDRAVQAIEQLQSAGVKVSVATTINALNTADFDSLSMLMESLGISEWNVDMPAVTGRLRDNPEFALAPELAAPYLSYGYGGSHHGSSGGFACGAHLCAVGPGGAVAKCGFYLDKPVGMIAEGLGECWSRIRHVRLSELSCECGFINECRGGCRFRASSFTDEFGPDPVRCHNLGVCYSGLKGGDAHDYHEGG